MRLKNKWLLLLWASPLALTVIISLSGAKYLFEPLGIALCFALLAAITDLAIGYAGLLNLGSAMPFAIGCYTTAFGIKSGWSFGITILLGGFLSSALLAVLGFICFRFGVSRLHYALGGLILSLSLEQVAIRAYDLLGGSNGITSVSKPIIIEGYNTNGLDYLFFVAIIISMLFSVLQVISNTQIGHLLEGIREDEDRIQCLGYDLIKIKVITVSILSFFGSIAGSFYVGFTGIAEPSLFSLSPNMEVLVWLAVGGMRTIYGPFLCAMAITLTRFELGSHLHDLYSLIIGLFFLATVIYRPDGLANIFKYAYKKS